MTIADQPPSDSERSERLQEYLTDKEALKGLDRRGQGAQDRIMTKVLIALYEGTLLHKPTADYDEGKYWFSADQICSKITGWDCVETPFKNTVKRQLERLESRGYVLHRKHSVVGHDWADQYAITDTGARYCHNTIPAWRTGLYPAILMMAKIESAAYKEAKQPSKKETSHFRTQEEMKLAYAFLKSIFSPEPDLRAEFYNISGTWQEGNDRAAAPPGSIWYVRPGFGGRDRTHSFSMLESWGDFGFIFDITYAVDRLRNNSKGNDVGPFDLFYDRLIGTKCPDCQNELNYLRKHGIAAVCGRTITAIVQELIESGDFPNRENWNQQLVEKITLLTKAVNKLEEMNMLLTTEDDKLAAYAILTSPYLMDMTRNSSYSLESKRYFTSLHRWFLHSPVLFRMFMQQPSLQVVTFVEKLQKDNLAQLSKTYEDIQFYTVTPLLLKVAKELWDSGAYYKLTLPKVWRDIVLMKSSAEQA